MSRTMMIDEAYCEQIRLRTGESVCLRMIRPSDKMALQEAFAELSDDSRHKRFFSAKHTLNEDELRYFTETDGQNHFALAAVMLDENGAECGGLGVARCIRFADTPECAEVAVTIIDRMQGKGIGKALLERLISAATERGIQRFRFECLAYNQEMQHLVRKVCDVVETHSDGDIVTVETRVPPPAQAPAVPAASQRNLYGIYDLFRALAIQSIDLQLHLGRGTMRRSLKSPFSSADLMRQIKRPNSSKTS